MSNKKAQSISMEMLVARVTILTAINNEQENVLHQACELGSRSLVEFIVKKAKEIDILQFIINAKDELG